MNSGMQCEVGLTPERILERLAAGEDAQLSNLSRLIGSLEGVADRLGEAQKVLFATGRWEGASATLANENFGIMQGNFSRLAQALNSRRERIVEHNELRREKAAELLHALPTVGVPGYVQDALNRNDVSVQTPFGKISLNEGAEKVADFFGAKRSEDAQAKLSEMNRLLAAQAVRVRTLPDFKIVPLKLADGTSANFPASAPEPGSYTTTLPQYPGGGWRRPGVDGPDSPWGPPDSEHPEGPHDPRNPEGPRDPSDPRNPRDPHDPNDPRNPYDPRNPHGPHGPNGTGGGPGLGVGLAGGGLAAAGLGVGARLAKFGGVGGFSGALGRGAGLGAAGGLRGGAGLAGGAAGGSSASTANAGSGAGRSGGMMGGGGGGSDEKKKRNEPGLGYIAPKYEDGGENGPAADASRAGRRRD